MGIEAVKKFLSPVCRRLWIRLEEENLCWSLLGMKGLVWILYDIWLRIISSAMLLEHDQKVSLSIMQWLKWSLFLPV